MQPVVFTGNQEACFYVYKVGDEREKNERGELGRRPEEIANRRIIIVESPEK